MLMRPCMLCAMMHSAEPLRIYQRLVYASPRYVCISAFMFLIDLAQDVHHVIMNGMACHSNT
jgi:hypothetical protein